MSLLNTDMKREKEHMATMLRMARDYARSEGLQGQLPDRAQADGADEHQYDVDTETVIGFCAPTGSTRTSRSTSRSTTPLAGHTFEHELQCAVDARMLGSIDANRGDSERLGHSTSSRSTSRDGAGHDGHRPRRRPPGGGTNFDAKDRRNSTDLEDIFIAHIAAMDVMARALLIAADILDNSPYEKMLAERYASYDQGEAKPSRRAGSRSNRSPITPASTNPCSGRQAGALRGDREHVYLIVPGVRHCRTPKCYSNL